MVFPSTPEVATSSLFYYQLFWDGTRPAASHMHTQQMESGEGL
jgi:hypothetical protein